MSHPDALIAVLDANVLYPQWLRDLMLTLAALGYYEPLWSDRIIEEMRRNVLADHPDIDPDRFDAVTINALRRAFPNAWIRVEDDLVERMDNAPEDRHVLAAAIAGDANAIVTANVDDFAGSRHVASGQIAIESPAAFLTTVLDGHPDTLADALMHLATNRRGVSTVTDVLDELRRNRALDSFVSAARAALL